MLQFVVYIIFDLEIDILIKRITSNQQKNTRNSFFLTKSHEKEVLQLFLALFVKSHIFAYLTLKLTHWTWKWP